MFSITCQPELAWIFNSDSCICSNPVTVASLRYIVRIHHQEISYSEMLPQARHTITATTNSTTTSLLNLLQFFLRWPLSTMCLWMEYVGLCEEFEVKKEVVSCRVSLRKPEDHIYNFKFTNSQNRDCSSYFKVFSNSAIASCWCNYVHYWQIYVPEWLTINVSIYILYMVLEYST